MTDRELMQQALEALNRSDYLGWQLNIPIIKALRERLAQPEQEPVAWMSDVGSVASAHEKKMGYVLESAFTTPLYTSPPAQRKPLTINEVEQILAQHNYEIHGDRARYIVRMTEAAHGIKENT